MDIDEALSDPQVAAVLEAWRSARLHDVPPYSGGVLDSWPALMVDGLSICKQEESAIGDWLRWREANDGPDPSLSR